MDSKTHQNRIVHRNSTGGFSLLLALLVASVALSIGIALLGLTVKQLDLSVTARDSEIAFHAASGGIECLQWFRYANSDVLLDGDNNNDTINNVQCLGQTFTFTDGDVGDSRRSYDEQFEGTFADETFCTQMEMIIETAGASDITMSLPGGSSKICPAGDTCTLARARGYNVECGQETTQFAVQRELTAEF